MKLYITLHISNNDLMDRNDLTSLIGINVIGLGTQ